MEIKVIKTQREYKEALSLIEKLIDQDPNLGTADARKLELLSLLVADYEKNNFPNETPDPIEAIKFRMEQENLTQRDLVPYIGSRSKVSEILSRKRPLTLPMIRALNIGLGIPVESLINPQSEEGHIDWNRFPLKEINKRKWINVQLDAIKNKAEDIIREFLQPLGSTEAVIALYRKNENIRSARSTDKYALILWNARIVMQASKKAPLTKFIPGSVSKDFIRKVIQLSPDKNGPILACDYLRKNGIPVIIEPHLSHTQLDGAAIMTSGGPVIGLTLRHDRIDNFWFCLIHELAHIALHFNNEPSSFYDDLDVENPADPREREADSLASEMLIPAHEWEKSIARSLRTAEAAERLAKKLKIHPAIVAGKMRHFFKSYRILNQLVGYHKVRILFSEVKWR